LSTVGRESVILVIALLEEGEKNNAKFQHGSTTNKI
jgi:hypothetical protein